MLACVRSFFVWLKFCKVAWLNKSLDAVLPCIWIKLTNVASCPTEQIKPQHIVGEDTLDDDEPRKGELGVPFDGEKIRFSTLVDTLKCLSKSWTPWDVVKVCGNGANFVGVLQLHGSSCRGQIAIKCWSACFSAAIQQPEFALFLFILFLFRVWLWWLKTNIYVNIHVIAFSSFLKKCLHYALSEFLETAIYRQRGRGGERMGGWIIRVQTKPTTVFVSSDTEDEIKLDKKDVVIVFFKLPTSILSVHIPLHISAYWIFAALTH